MLLVLGGGPAGRLAAIRAAEAGVEVTLVEKRSLGGQCLHDGCMQVCGLNDIARILDAAGLAERAGITRGRLEIDFPGLIREISAIQQTIASILDDETRSAGVEVIYGAAGEIREGKPYIDGRAADAEKVIVATGSRPNIPDIEGITRPGVFTPHTLKEIPGLPERIGIIGGGVMAAEFAYIFSKLGAETHLFSRSRFLHQIPPRLAKEAAKDLASVIIHEDANVSACLGEERVTGVRLDGTTLDLDCILIAAGLLPDSGMVTGVRKGEHNEILVNSRFETSVPGIYACGDVIGEPCLTPVARLQGVAAADAALGRDNAADLTCLPRSMSLGYEYTWMDADDDEGVSLTLPGPAGPGTFWSVPERRTGIASLTINEESGRILGFAEASPAAGVMGMYLGYLAKKGESVCDLREIFEVHPTADGMYTAIRYSDFLLKKRREKA